MYLELQQRLLARVREVIQSKYEIELGPIAIEQPPDVKLGEFALPIAFELARKLRKAPKIIATELAAALSEGADDAAFASFESAGAGYLNVRLNRSFAAAQLASKDKQTEPNSGLHVLVEQETAVTHAGGDGDPPRQLDHLSGTAHGLVDGTGTPHVAFDVGVAGHVPHDHGHPAGTIGRHHGSPDTRSTSDHDR